MTTLELPSPTREFIRVKVGSKLNGVAVDPTLDPVELAFKDTATALPEDGDWQDGDWETDPTPTTGPVYYARCIPDPPLAAGTHTVWVRVHDNPETVVRRLTGKLVIKP